MILRSRERERVNPVLDSRQEARYRRNILLPGFGREGQEKLLKSGVLLVGAGGLGSPAAFYLAAAGVGRIGIIDPDTVEVSNLQRQILHGTPDIGRPKALSAGESLLHIDPRLRVDAVACRLDRENGRELIGDYDIVLDCTDNFEARYIINDICLELKKPFLYGGVMAFGGQLMMVLPDKGPCFRCLYPAEKNAALPDFSNTGVLGTVPGVIGTLQACEAVKYLTGLGRLIAGRLLVYDALAASFFEVGLERDPSCPACGRKEV
ncbi:MAG: HesA/MoeB/ThiF family protein [Bacillota bacterium]